MQHDQSKLKEAWVRRRIALFCGMFAIPAFGLWGFHTAFSGYDVPFGEIGGYVALTLLATAVWVIRPVYRLEWPFQHSLDKTREGDCRQGARDQYRGSYIAFGKIHWPSFLVGGCVGALLVYTVWFIQYKI